MLALSASFGGFAQKRANKKADKQMREWRYEMECAGIGQDGTYLIKVWSFSKKPAVAAEHAKKNAVHGVIFKGFTGAQGCTGQKALTSDVNLEQEKADFFDPFFDEGGKYMKFVNCTSDGVPDANSCIKVGKEYKVGIIVSVAKDALRKDLEQAGIIKGLSSGF